MGTMRSRMIQKDVLGIELERASASTRGVDGRGLEDVRGGRERTRRMCLVLNWSARRPRRAGLMEGARKTFAEARERTRMLIARIRLNG